MKKDTAAALLSTRIPTARIGMTVEAVRRAVLHERCHWDSVTYVYVLDAQDHPVGVVSMKELICADAKAPIEAVMTSNVVTAHPSTDQEHVAMRAIRHGIKAVPIVERDGRFLGVVGTDAMLKTLHRAHVEDLLRFAGVRRTRNVTDVLHAPIGALIRYRLPWLLVGLLGAIIMTLVARSFEHTLEREIAIAFFIPLIVYMADALGTQTQTLYIRAIAIGAVPVRRYLLRELGASLGMSGISAVALFAFAMVLFQRWTIAWAVSLALLIAMLTASTLAIVITAALARSRRDPALGGGPLATAIQDIVSLLVYFLVANAIIF
ncbi:MAG: magnesium transporter [bacterium]|nr:magnesium transporter [bacterium]MDP3771306.1 magnesium transporter [bacterium]